MGIQESIKMQNPAVSPLKGYDNARDKERTTVQAGHQNTSQYAKEAELGELMTEMMTTLLLSKPDAPVDFLIDLLSASRSQRIAVCAPPGVKLESVVKATANDLGVIVVSVPPLIVLQCENDVGGTEFDLIQVRNPWGSGEFTS